MSHIVFNWPWDIDGIRCWVWMRWEYEDGHGFRLLGVELHWHEEPPPR